MSHVLVHPPEARPRSRRLALLAAGVAASIAVFALLLVLVQRPDFVSRLSIENRSAFALQVDVAPGRDEPVTQLGVVGAHSTETFGDVVDQGDTWVLQLSDPGRGARTLRYTRSQLEHSHWRVTIPASFDTQAGAGRGH